jgi:hypothetical protein
MDVGAEPPNMNIIGGGFKIEISDTDLRITHPSDVQEI